jgi:hypothetical protein
MAVSEFSETQYVFGFLNEMHFYQTQRHPYFPFWEYFMFPSTIIERAFPGDFFVDHYSHSEFYQFKRSDHLAQRRGSAEIRAGLPVNFLDYYRFKVYNRTTFTTTGQFDKLRQLAAVFNTDLVCYAAPCFHTEWEFHENFRNRTILQNSILIECNQFNNPIFLPPNFNINDGASHYFVFKQTGNPCYLCSEPKNVKSINGGQKNDYIKLKKGKEEFLATIKKLYSDFYLEDKLENSSSEIKPIEKIFTENAGKQLTIVSEYLFRNYNIIWQPIFIENK